MKWCWSIFLSFLLASAIALEIDSTFLARFLKFSDSKRTVLINQGLEAGLKEGDHAKISLPGGMVARAVVVKLAPTRSVWSVYRFVNQDKLVPQTVATFKITSAIKLTSDESKHLGAFAETIEKQNQEREREQLERDKKALLTDEEQRLEGKRESLRQSIGLAEKKGSLSLVREFSSLEDESLAPPRNPQIDWSGLDGGKDDRYFESQVDYSALK